MSPLAWLLVTLALPPPPPWPAYVTAEAANVRVAPSTASPVVGELAGGDEVIVGGCVPACDANGGWALVAGGAVSLSALAAGHGDFAPSRATFRYGRVRGEGAREHVAPDERSPVRRRFRAGEDLAFRGAPDGWSSPWLQRGDGGWVKSSDVRPHEPSAFAGLLAPSLPFTLRGRTIAFVRRRPGGLGDDARWVHVDLSRQLLTAYEGDRLVFATLVSTGREHPTPTGRFRVWYKAVHASMRGQPPDEPYFVDEVPDAMFIRRGVALHGAFWHDGFGQPRSHGCINLSLADAAWLFAWSPPMVPTGWRALEPDVAHKPTLDVIIEASIRERDRAGSRLFAGGAPAASP